MSGGLVSTGRKQEEMFADAIEASANNPTSPINVSAIFSTDPKDIAKFMEKRKSVFSFKAFKAVLVKIKDPNILRLVRKMLKAGIIEDFQYEETEEGSGQGPCVLRLLQISICTMFLYGG